MSEAQSVAQEILSISEAFAEEMALLNAMEAAALPEELDQCVRDLVRLIHDHGKGYAGTEHGDMTLPLLRALNKLVQEAA